jgi:methyl-accepting chemotaxis protein
MKKRKSIKNQMRKYLFISAAFVILVTYFILSSVYNNTLKIQSQSYSDAMQSFIIADAGNQMGLISEKVNEYFKSYENMINLAVYEITRASVTGTTEKEIFKKYYETRKVAMYIAETDGSIDIIHPPMDLAGYDFSERAWFKNAEVNEIYWADPYEDAGGNGIIITASTKLSNGKVLGLDIYINDIKTYVSSLELTSGGYVALATNSGVTIVHRNPDLEMTEIPVPEIKDFVASGETDGVVNYYFMDEDRTSLISRVGNMNLYTIGAFSNSALSKVRDEIVAEISTKIMEIRIGFAMFFIIILITIFIISFYVSKVFTEPIMRITNVANQISDKNLYSCYTYKNKNEIGELADSLYNVRTNFLELFFKLKESTDEMRKNSVEIGAISEYLKNSTDQMTHSTEDISKGSSHLAESITSLNDLIIKDFSGTIDGMTIAITKGIISITEIDKLTKHNTDVIDGMYCKLTSNKELAEDMNIKLSEVATSISSIDSITVLFRNISKQTGLLALNASIEAARAGEHGKSFSVVAEEIRKLANDAEQSINKISSLLNTVVISVNNLIATSNTTFNSLTDTTQMEELISSVKDIMSLTDSLSRDFNQVAKDAKEVEKGKARVSEMVESITAVAEETAAATQEISSSITEMAAKASEVNDILEENSKQIKDLVDEVSSYKTEE